MKKTTIQIAALAVLFALLCVAALGEGARSGLERYLDTWVCGDYALTLWQLPDGELNAWLIRLDEDATAVWEYGPCWYDDGEDTLYGASCVRYREFFDEASQALDQEDWSLNDMSFATFQLTEDDTLIARDIDGLDDTLELERLDDTIGD